MDIELYFYINIELSPCFHKNEMRRRVQAGFRSYREIQS